MTWTPVHVEISAGHGSIIGARDGTLDRDFNAEPQRPEPAVAREAVRRHARAAFSFSVR
jgi:hypothetical protein